MIQKFSILLFFLFVSNQIYSQVSQIEEISGMNSGDFDVFSFDEKKKSKKGEKKWPVSFIKSENLISEIVINRAGIIEEKYSPDLIESPAYFKGSKDIVITVLDERIYYYSYSIKTGATLKYIITNK